MDVQPVRNLRKKMEIVKRGALVKKRAKILISKLPQHIAERERKMLLKQGWFETDEVKIIKVEKGSGQGNAVIITLKYEDLTCMFQAIGERGKRAERVAMETYNAAILYHSAQMPVESHLTDQLLLYMGLISKGTLLTNDISLHSETNMSIVEKFLPVKFSVKQIVGGEKIEITGDTT